MQEHKEQLEMLKAQDPEFYEYLKQNDQRLLDFVPEEEGSEESGDEEGDEDGGHIGNASDAVEDGASSQDSDDSEVDDGAKVITTQQIEDWRQLVETKSQLRALHSLVVAFKCAAHAGDDQATAAETSLSLPYTLADENAFTELIIAVVRHVPPALHHHLKTEGKQTSILPSQSKHWTRHQMVVKTFVKSAMYLLSQLTDPAMVEFILRELDKSGGVVFFASQPRSKTCKEFLRFLIRHWSSVPTADETANSEAKETLRIVAFLCIRQLALLTAKCVPDLLNTIHKVNINASSLNVFVFNQHTTFITAHLSVVYGQCKTHHIQHHSSPGFYE
jgi:nucleolar complex protein 2